MAKNGNKERPDQDAYISFRRLKEFWSRLQGWLSTHYVPIEEYNALKERVQALENNLNAS